MKVLITAATGAKAYQLKNKLSGHTIILGDFAELPAMLINNGSALKLPNPADPAYAHLMLALCLDEQIAQVYVLNPAEWLALSEATQLFLEYGITILSAHDEI